MIYFSGGNNREYAHALEGRAILVSFADVMRGPCFWSREILPRLRSGVYPAAMLDSGAFSELSERQRGKANPIHVDVEEYGRFCLKHGHLFEIIATLDDIEGDVARTWRNTATLRALGVSRACPVFHGNEPWGVLEHYASRFGRVGLGFARVGGRIACRQKDGLRPVEWIRRCLGIIDGRAAVHGFGMTRYAHKLGLPLDSTDSTTWIAEWLACPHRANPRERLASLELVLGSYEREPAGVQVGMVAGQAKTACERYAPRELDAFVEAGVV